MTKTAAVLDLFRKGSEVANPALWKAGQISVNALGAALYAGVELGRQFGYAVPITKAETFTIAGAFLSIFNMVMTVVTSKRAGLPAKETP